MSVQTSYKFIPNAGAPGGIVDLTPYAIDAFANAENDGVLMLGMGVVPGSAAGTVKKPVAGSTAAQFLGVSVNGRSHEYDDNGVVYVRNKATIGVMRYGRVYVRVKSGVSVSDGDPLLLIKSGEDAGLFTKTAADNTLAVAGKFIGPVSNGVAPAHLYDAPASAVTDNDTVYTLPKAAADTLGGVKVGTGLAIDADGVLSVSGNG